MRIIDNAGPEPAQRFRPDDFLAWVRKQCALARQVFSCYQAGAGGFVLHRQLSQLGVTNHLVHPRKLDRDGKGVQNDSLDRARTGAGPGSVRARQSQSAAAGARAHAPTGAAPRPNRQRQQLMAQRLSLAAQGRSLLLSPGWQESNHWWKAARWERLAPQLPAWLREGLEIFQRLIRR